jgi:hypothetical protein
MLSSYGLLLVVYALCTFIRPRTSEDYKCTLQIFQFLVSILSCIAIVQFAVQFVVDGRQIISFFGVVPDSLMAGKDLANTIGPVSPGSSLIKSNGIFLGEPSTLSQVAALGIIIEVVEFRRARYLALLVLGLLLSYSGSGIIMLLVGLPLASLINRKAQLPLVVVSVFAFGLLATGMIDLSAFTDRMDEFENTQASAFIRFVSPFWMLAEHFDAASLLELLFGKGPSAEFAPRAFYYANSATWSRLIYEYGLIGTLFFTCFLGSCLRRSRCPTPAIAALLSLYLFNGQNLHSTWLVIVIVVLCTLNLPDLRRGRINETRSRSSSFLESRIA